MRSTAWAPRKRRQPQPAAEIAGRRCGQQVCCSSARPGQIVHVGVILFLFEDLRGARKLRGVPMQVGELGAPEAQRRSHHAVSELGNTVAARAGDLGNEMMASEFG
jgi:hypothetical protein